MPSLRDLIGRPFIAALVCALATAPAAHAQEAAPPALVAADVAAFADGYFPTEMERAGIAGLSVTVVKDGQVLLSRGYGLADRAGGRPMTAQSLVRIGSISKLFAWTAVMQLVERHQLDLDADVQKYIDFELPRTFAQPITLRHLMTHTAGFEETFHGMWAGEGESMDLRDYLVARVPARLNPPGAVAAYSNYGATLAGYIVQRVSGEPFDAYVQRHILQPLAMTHTTFTQPVPAALAPALSLGYDQAADPARPFERIRVAPAGSASASAEDMARFMRAELADGSLDGGRILQPGTLATMQTAQWWPQPHAPAMALGFWEDGGYGTRVIGHGGDTQWFHSGLYLLPAEHVGVFVSQNSAGQHILRDTFMRRFMARYFPTPAAAFPPGPPPASAVDGLAGHYLASRHGESGPLALLAMLSQTPVAVSADGTLTDGSPGLDGRPVKYRWRGDGLWQSPDEPSRRLWFKRGADGLWQMNGRIPAFVDQQVPASRSAAWLAPTLGVALALLVASLLAWPVASLLRWRYARPLPAGRAERRPRIALRLAAGLMLLPWIVFALVLVQATESYTWLSGPQALAWLRVVQGLAWLALAGVALAAWALGARWRLRGAGAWARVHAGLVLAAGLALAGFAWAGHLLVNATAL